MGLLARMTARHGCARRRVAWLAACLLGIAASAGPGAAAPAASRPCRDVSVGANRYAICEIDLRADRLQLFWKGPDGAPYGSLQTLVQALRQSGRDPLFAMNAGMYRTDLSPLGLFVADGRVLAPVNTANGSGNFYLKPNGVFYVRGADAGLLETSRYVAQHPRVDLATQSGPMLVIHGQLNPHISEHGTSRKIRNGVGVRDAHHVVFAISDDPVTFGEFAHLFRDRFGCANALFLDGSVSSLYAPSLGRSDLSLPLGPMIAAFRR